MRLLERFSVAGKLMVVGGVAIGALLVLASWFVVGTTGGMVRGLSDRYSEATAAEASAMVSSEFGQVEAAGRALAEAVGAAHDKSGPNRQVVLEILRRNVDATDMVFGAWFVPAPTGYDGRDAQMVGRTDLGSNSRGEFIPYWIQDNGKLAQQPVEDPEVHKAEYFARPFSTGKPWVTAPYSWNVGSTTVLMTSVTVPVRSGGKIIGVVGLDMELNKLSARLGVIRPFGDGRVMLLSANRSWVSHPDASLHTKPYDGPGGESIDRVIAGGKPEHINGVADETGAVERLVPPVILPGIDEIWALVVDVPSATVLKPVNDLQKAVLGGGVLIISVVLGTLFLTAVAVIKRPLAGMTAAMARLANGDLTVDVPARDRQDEIGSLAAAMTQFKDNALEMQRLEAEAAEASARAEAEKARAAREAEEAKARQEAEAAEAKARAEAERKAALLKMADEFEASVKTVVDMVASAAVEMESTASMMASAAEETSRQATLVAAASDQAASNVNMVAGATEELSASVREIGQQAASSASIANQASEQARHTVIVVAELEKAAKEIGQVVYMIRDIAEQSKLLALNATIEAERAGQAGRGFAVVASEVKNLADQTAQATGEIAQKIDQIQRSTGAAVSAIDGVGEAIQRVDHVSAAIAGAVEQQRAATAEIAGNVHEAAQGTIEVTSNIGGVTKAAADTGSAAMIVQSSASSLARNADELKAQVARFLATVRAA